MAVNWGFWQYFFGGVVFFVLFVHALGTNLWAHWHADINGRKFVSVVAPGALPLLMCFFGGVVGATLTLIFPDPEVLWTNPYDKPWVLPHHRHAAMYLIFSTTSLSIWLGRRYTTSPSENRTHFLMMFALMLGLVQYLLEGMPPVPISGSTYDWDHPSPLQYAAHVSFRVIVYPLIATYLLEMFMMESAVTMMRLILMLSYTGYYFFMAVAFGSGWCDDMDGPEDQDCRERSMKVNMYVLIYAVPLIIALSTFFISLLWFRYVPQSIVNFWVPKNRVPPASRSAHDAEGGRADVGDTGMYSVQQDDDEVIALDADQRARAANF